MSYRDRLRPASFRGVPFFVTESQGDVGRRVARHDFPLRELPFTEDLGRRAREFKVEGFVIGADYDLARDRLLEALEAPGPGRLVHPYRGTFDAVVLEASYRESSSEGRAARFAISFLEAGALVTPEVRDSPGAVVDAAAAILEDAQSSSFAAAITVDDVPAFVPEAAASAWQRVKDLFDQADLAGEAVLVDRLRRNLEDVTDEFLDRIRQPSLLGATLQDLFASIEQAASSRLVAFRVYLGIERCRAQLVGGTSPLQLAAQRNADQVVILARSLSLAGAARAISLADFDTYDDAVAARDELLGRLDELAEGLGDDGFRGATRLRAELLRSVPGEENDLPHLDLFTPAAVLPALVLAWQLYADRDREGEILTRNRVEHPGFVPIAPLEVKSA